MQRLLQICLWKCWVSPKFRVWNGAHLESCWFSSKAGVDFAMNRTFQVKCSINLHVVISGFFLPALKVSCLAKYAQDVNIELSTWEKLSTFKGKCAVNAVNFKWNLLTGPLINWIFKVGGQSLKLSNNVLQHMY